MGQRILPNMETILIYERHLSGTGPFRNEAKALSIIAALELAPEKRNLMRGILRSTLPVTHDLLHTLYWQIWITKSSGC
ncbi:hypothetical protein CS542_04445 [Pedobacter sp. IW39]|nr:hypothetical protein CS542_04445 [Pedobacter sp. IW39]